MDIDIDLQSDFDPSDIFPKVVRAMIFTKEHEVKKHPAGHYFQSIPTDPMTGLAAIPYDRAEELGFYKIDFLHLGLLDHFKSKEEIRALTKIEPDWSLLLDETIYDRIFQLGRHHSMVSKIKPKSVQDVADCVALIRPGKHGMIEKYISATQQGRAALRRELYKKPDAGQYYFKKSHATAYALTVKLQLHLFKEGLI